MSAGQAQPLSPPSPAGRQLAVVGAGWAGLAAAVRAVQQGWQVSLFEMAHQAGGRARSVHASGRELDNGQHILIGAYQRTLALMHTVGAPVQELLWRGPLALLQPDGTGLCLPPGAPVPAFARAVLGHASWSWRDKAALLAACSAWWLRGFRCAPELSVATLCQGLPPAVRADLIDPLCVAALNTEAGQASAQVFLRVLQDALFSGPGSADLLLPRRPLSALLPEPAIAWLSSAGAQLHLGHRVHSLAAQTGGWRVDDQHFDAVVLATTAREAGRLAAEVAPEWAAAARQLAQEPILTVYLHSPSLVLAQPMLALPSGSGAPAQFLFDVGQLGGEPGLFAAVASGAGACLQQGVDHAAAQVQQQLRGHWPMHFANADAVVHAAAERRATFACVPGLQRPGLQLATGLVAAGDYIAGPYPATLEGAVRSGEAAVGALA